MGMVDDGLNVTSNTKFRTILITDHTCVLTWVVSILVSFIPRPLDITVCDNIITFHFYKTLQFRSILFHCMEGIPI